jgi:hypothetical protein
MAVKCYCTWSGQRVTLKRGITCIKHDNASNSKAKHCGTCRYGYSLPQSGEIPQFFITDHLNLHGGKETERNLNTFIYGVKQ